MTKAHRTSGADTHHNLDSNGDTGDDGDGVHRDDRPLTATVCTEAHDIGAYVTVWVTRRKRIPRVGRAEQLVSEGGLEPPRPLVGH